MSDKKAIILYGFTHALVDAVCAAVVFSMPGSVSLDKSWYFFLVVLYDVLAFGLQPVAGFFMDMLKIPSFTSAAGCLLTAAAALSINLPLAAICLAGLGNALFHVGGGSICLNLKPGSAGPAGAYVAPGAIGLFIGTLVGKGGYFHAWFFILLLMSAGIILLISKPPKIQYDAGRNKTCSHFSIILLLLLSSIAIRSLVGFTVSFPWKSNIYLLTVLTIAVALGKAAGGVLSDKFGWIKVTITGLIISAPLLSFGSANPYLAITGIFMFNLTMPVTLVAVSRMFPGYTGFAFGLTTLGLITGAIPAFTSLKPAFAGELTIFAVIMVSALMLYIGLKLYLRGDNVEKMNGRFLYKLMALLSLCFLLYTPTAYADVASPSDLIIGAGALIAIGIIISVVIALCVLIIIRIRKKHDNK